MGDGPTAGEALSVAHVEDAARKRPLRYDRAGDRHYDLASAFIKSMRGSDPDAAVYYLAAMLEGGEDARFLARRIVIAASEDVGNADPRALLVAVAAAQAVEHVGLPEAQLNLAQAAIYVARAPKSNASARAIWQARTEVRREGIAGRRPRSATPTTADRPRAGTARATSPRTTIPAAAGIDHLPEGLRGRAYYVPSANGEEAEDGRVTIGTGDKAPEFDLEEVAGAARAAVELPRALQRAARLPSVRVHADVHGGGQDLQENLASFRNANTEIVFVSCDASAARQAWKRELGAEYTFASDFWSHGATAKRYGVFNEENGAPIRGTFLIDTDGVVIWSLVKDGDRRRTRWCPSRSRRSARP